MKTFNPVFSPDEAVADAPPEEQSFDEMMAAIDSQESVSFSFVKAEEEPAAEEIAQEEPVAEAQEPASEGEQAPEEAPEETPVEAAPTLDVSEFESLLPDGAVLESADDLREHLQTYVDSHQTLSRFEALVAGDEPLMAYVKERQGGVPARVAAVKAFGELANVPDAIEDPEGYAEWLADQRVSEFRKQTEAEKTQAVETRRQSVADQAASAYEQFVKKAGLQPEQAQRLGSLFNSITTGDPVTGRFRSDAFEMLWAGSQAKAVQAGVQSAIESAEKGDLKAIAPSKDDHPMVASVKKALTSAYREGTKAPGKKKATIPNVPEIGSRGGSAQDQPKDDFAASLQRKSMYDHPAFGG